MDYPLVPLDELLFLKNLLFALIQGQFGVIYQRLVLILPLSKNDKLFVPFGEGFQKLLNRFGMFLVLC